MASDPTVTMLKDGTRFLGESRRHVVSDSMTVYVCPCRCMPEGRAGGPTFGVSVDGEEVLRFDCHGISGHWHRGGIGPAGTVVPFPEGVPLGNVDAQIKWSLNEIPRILCGLEHFCDSDELIKALKSVGEYLESEECTGLHKEAIDKKLLVA